MIDTKKGVKCIRLITENCEAIMIDRSHISYFLLDDIRRSIHSFDMSYAKTEDTAKLFAISINEKADVPYQPYNNAPEITVFERLAECANITIVEIIYLDGNTESFYVDWDEKEEYINPYQDTVIENNLFIVISKEKNVDDVFGAWLGHEEKSLRRHDPDNINLQVSDVDFFCNDQYEGMNIAWVADIGFGEYCIVKEKETGKWIGESECMDINEDKAFLSKLMDLCKDKLLENIEING